MASYTIVRGDTLDRIAQRFGTTYQELARRNGIPDPNKISEGAVIEVPPYDVAPAASDDDQPGGILNALYDAKAGKVKPAGYVAGAAAVGLLWSFFA